MLPPATASHHHSLLPPLEVSITHTPKEILQDANDDGVPYSYFKDEFSLIPFVSTPAVCV